jgi:primosomal protein N' (replication factor Y)
VLGPAPCPIERLRGRWRWHLLLKGTDAGDLGSLLRYAAVHDPVGGSNRLEIDRDPESLL